jgi:hypothetical protein
MLRIREKRAPNILVEQHQQSQDNLRKLNVLFTKNKHVNEI